MNWKQFVIAVIVGFVALSAMDFVINVVILADAYAPLEGTVFRNKADMDSKMWAFFLGEFIFVLMFIWVYSHGLKGKGIMEGLRYGLYVGLMLWVLSSLAMWAMFPVSAWLAWMWAIFGVIEMVILGLIVGAIYKTVRE